MAAKVFYVGAGGNTLTETSPGAEAFASAAGAVTGWVVSTGAGVDYSLMNATVERAASTFGATVLPTSGLDTGGVDFWGTGASGPYTGTFAAGNWVADFVARANTLGGAQDGAALFRLYRATLSNGTGTNVELTSAAALGTTVTDLATTASQTSSATIALGAVTLTNEHIIWQVAWKRTGAGGMTTADVNVRVGTTGSKLTSPDFTAGGGGAIAAAEGMTFGQAAALTGSGALAGVAPEVFGNNAVIKGTGALAGVAANVFGNNVALTTLPSAIAGVAANVFGEAAVLKGTGALAGIAAEVFSQNAVIRADGALAGVAPEAFGNNAALTAAGSGAMAAVGALTFGQNAVLTASGALAGLGTIIFSDSATLIQPAAPVVASTGQTPAGKSRKRRWVVGNRVFYGTEAEAAELAESLEVSPEPVIRPKKIKRAKPAVVDEIRILEVPDLPAIPTLDFGLLNDRLAGERMARQMSEMARLLHIKQLEEDDEDVLLLL